MYTFNSTLQTLLGVAQNVGEKQHDKVKDRPAAAAADQSLPLFCVTPQFFLLLWLTAGFHNLAAFFFQRDPRHSVPAGA